VVCEKPQNLLVGGEGSGREMTSPFNFDWLTVLIFDRRHGGGTNYCDHEIHCSIPLFSLRCLKFWEFLKAKWKHQSSEGQIPRYSLRSHEISGYTKIHLTPFKSSNIHINLLFCAAGENFEKFGRSLSWKSSFLRRR